MMSLVVSYKIWTFNYGCGKDRYYRMCPLDIPEHIYPPFV